MDRQARKTTVHRMNTVHVLENVFLKSNCQTKSKYWTIQSSSCLRETHFLLPILEKETECVDKEWLYWMLVIPLSLEQIFDWEINTSV